MNRKRELAACDFADYFLGKGWVFESDEVSNGQKTIVCSEHPGLQLYVPVGCESWTAESVMDFSLKLYSEATGLTPEELRYQIAHVHDDVVRIRLYGGLVRRDLALHFSATLVSALHTVLRTGYCVATRQKNRYALGNADQTCARTIGAKLEYDYIDGVSVRLACPLGLSRAEIESRAEDRPVPLVRRSMRMVREMFDELFSVIEEGRKDEYLKSLTRRASSSSLPADFCEALVALFDPSYQNSLEVSFLWSPHVPVDNCFLEPPIHFSAAERSFISNVYQELASIKQREDYVGTLSHLQPDNPDGSPGTGKAVFSILTKDGSVVPVQVDLSEDNYAKALKIKRSHEFAWLSGVLVSTAIPSALARMALTQVERFEVLTTPTMESR